MLSNLAPWLGRRVATELFLALPAWSGAAAAVLLANVGSWWWSFACQRQCQGPRVLTVAVKITARVFSSLLYVAIATACLRCHLI